MKGVLLRSIQAALIACLALSAQGPKISPRQDFQAEAPAQVVAARIWSDVVWFYPFRTPKAQQEWELRYCQSLNAFTSTSGDLRAFLSETLGALNDVGTMVLSPEEGQGNHFLPVIYDLKPEGIYIVGGDASQVRRSFGPIERVNGVSLDQFLAQVIGKGATRQRQVAALMTVGRRSTPMTWRFQSGAGEMEVRSVQSIPESLFVEGGKTERLLTQLLRSKSPLPSEGSLDFRDAHWLLQDPSLLSSLRRFRGFQIRKASKGIGVARALRVRVGYAEEGTRLDEAYVNSVSIENLQPAQTGDLLIKLPPVISDASLAGLLAGWALPGQMGAPARSSRFHIAQGIEVTLSTGLFLDPVDALGMKVPPQNSVGLLSEHLSDASMRALAAATIVNYDHQFSFTPAENQEQVFRSAITAFMDGRAVQEIAQAVAPALNDAHFLNDLYTIGLMPLSDSEDWTTIGFLPFLACGDSKGGAVIVQSADPQLTSGMEVLEIEGRKMEDLLAWAKKAGSQRPDDDTGRIFWTLSSCMARDQETVRLKVRLLNGNISEVVARKIRTGKNGFQKTNKPLPVGVEWYSPLRPATFSDLRRGIEEGKTVVLDMRGSWPARSFKDGGSFGGTSCAGLAGYPKIRHTLQLSSPPFDSEIKIVQSWTPGGVSGFSSNRGDLDRSGIAPHR